MESRTVNAGIFGAVPQSNGLGAKGQKFVKQLNDLFDPKKVARLDALHYSRICLMLARERHLLISTTSVEIVGSFFWRALDIWMDDAKFPLSFHGKRAADFAKIACAGASLTEEGVDIIHNDRFQAFVKAFPTYCSEFSVPEASNCFCVLAMLGIQDEVILPHMRIVVHARLQTGIAVPRDITNVMWAAAMLGIKESRFIAVLLQVCRAQIPFFDMQSLANNLWATMLLDVQHKTMMSDLTVRFTQLLLHYGPMSSLEQHVAQQMILVLHSSHLSREDKVMLGNIISKVGMRVLLDRAFYGCNFVSAFTANKSIIKDIFDALKSASLFDKVIMGHWIVADHLPIAIYGTKMKNDGTVMKFAIELDLGTERTVADASDSNVDIPLEVHDNQPITPSSAYFRNCIMEAQELHVVHISVDEWNRAKLEGKATSYLQSILPQTPPSPKVGFSYIPMIVKETSLLDIPCRQWDLSTN